MLDLLISLSEKPTGETCRHPAAQAGGKRTVLQAMAEMPDALLLGKFGDLHQPIFEETWQDRFGRKMRFGDLAECGHDLDALATGSSTIGAGAGLVGKRLSISR